jgi:hypothetical protein
MVNNNAPLKEVLAHIARNDPDQTLRYVAEVVNRLMPDAVKLRRMATGDEYRDGVAYRGFYRSAPDEVHISPKVSGGNVKLGQRAVKKSSGCRAINHPR